MSAAQTKIASRQLTNWAWSSKRYVDSFCQRMLKYRHTFTAILQPRCVLRL